LASQDAQLRKAGCTKIYAEKVSGSWSDRPELAKLLKRLDRGDVLIVTRLDRLARSTRDLLNILDGAGFKSLSDAWANTTTPHGRLMLTVLGGLAEFERELIIARTGEGRTRAKDLPPPRWQAECAAIPEGGTSHDPTVGVAWPRMTSWPETSLAMRCGTTNSQARCVCSYPPAPS
jgi:Resolvase, N terminal domain